MQIKQKNNTLILGVTGHRDLLEKDWKVIVNGDKVEVVGELLGYVKAKLQALEQETPHKRLLLLSGMAEGADLLLCYVARELKIEYIAVLPFAPEEYLSQFESEAQKQLFRELLQTAEAVEVVTQSEGQDPYRAVGWEIARHSDELIALWNGVDTGLAGGTWEVVTMARTGKDADGRRLSCLRDKHRQAFRLHHLLTPRQKSPYPIPRFFDTTSINALLPLGTAYSWITLTGGIPKELSWWGKTWRWFVEYRYGFFKYFMTLLLFTATIVVGGIGIHSYAEHAAHLPNATVHHIAWWEAFYKAIKFSAIFPPPFDYEASAYSPTYVWGKVLGLIFFMYSASVAVVLLMGDTARRVVVRWLFGRIFRPFNLILSLNEKSFDVLTDLRLRREWVVALEHDHDSPYYEDSQQQGAIVIGDEPQVPVKLKDVGFQRAKEVYILGDNDSENLHLVQQMDRLLVERQNHSSQSTWYVQVQDAGKRQFLNKFTYKLPNVSIYSFNLYENIARRLLIQYPIDRFYHNPSNDTSHVFIFGFGNLGHEILRNCLKMGHFGKGRKLAIHIFAEDADEQQAAFAALNPCLAPMITPDAIPAAFDSVLGRELLDEVFGHISLHFHELPQNDFALLHDTQPLYDALRPEGMVSIYFTLEDEFASAAHLSSLLERLNALQQQTLNGHSRCDVQVFCYYNFPNEAETALVERRFNELAPHVPVVCFGNFLNECSARSIRDRALDQLPQLAALYYDEVIDKQKLWEDEAPAAIIERAKANWRTKKEMDKESNRLFADHAFVKMRLVWETMTLEEKQRATDTTTSIAQELREWLQKGLKDYQEVANLEHRRWCAEKLLDGWIPLLTDPAEIAESVQHWKNDKPFKTLARAQKQHLDLVPTARLAQIEVAKDTKLIEGIAAFIGVLRG